MRRVNAVAATAAVAIGLFTGPARATSRCSKARGSSWATAASSRTARWSSTATRSSRPAPGVAVPAGATRVNLAGKTVMPAIIDTHVHLSANARRLIRDLKQRGYWGVSAAMSLGTDNLELMLDMRNEVDPRRRALLQRRTRHHPEGADAPDVPDRHRGGGPQGGAGERGAQGRHHQGLGRRPRRQGPEGHAGKICRRHRRGAQARHARHRAHLQHGGRARA